MSTLVVNFELESSLRLNSDDMIVFLLMPGPAGADPRSRHVPGRYGSLPVLSLMKCTVVIFIEVIRHRLDFLLDSGRISALFEYHEAFTYASAASSNPDFSRHGRLPVHFRPEPCTASHS